MKTILFFSSFFFSNCYLINSIFKNTLKISSDLCDENIGIVIFPGYGKNADNYKSISEKICDKLKKNNIGSTIIINNYLKNIPLAGNIQTKILTKNSIELIKEKKNIDKIYFIGHSAGSYFLNDIANEYGNGFIQIGSVLNSNGILPWEKNNLYKYPIPTLTLVGQKDGYINPFFVKDELENIQYLNNTLIKPVIIEKNISPMYFVRIVYDVL